MFGVIFAQTGFRGNVHHPAADLPEDLGIFSHRRAHLAFGQAVRAREVQLEPIDAGFLAAFDDLDPRVASILLHDRGDQDAIGILILAALEFFEPDLERAIADQLDVFPAEDFACDRWSRVCA